MDIDHPWRRHRSAVVELGTSLFVPPGTRLTVEGARGAEFFVIRSGHAVVHRGGRQVAVLGPGDHFGEIALIDPATRRTATVTAEGDLQVQVFDRREFASLLDRDAVLARRILRDAVERLLVA